MANAIDMFEKNTMEDFLNFAKGKKIVIFCASNEAKRALKHELSNVTISYICDNNSSRWGQQFCGYEIKSPDTLLSEDMERLVVVISCRTRYFYEIYSQIKSLKVQNHFFSFLFEPEKNRNYYQLRFRDEYFFEDRRKNHKKLLVVIAGYKEFLWDIVFKRIARFLSPEIDVCVVLPGLQNDNIKGICEKNGWSYLSIAKNRLSTAQNIAIDLHQNAELIYKLDEDIFIGKNYFTNLEKAYHDISENAPYKMGFLAPLIPVNTFGYRYFLDKYGVYSKYEKSFGRFGYTAYSNPEAAKFLWKYSLPFDKAVNEFLSEPLKYEVCPHRFRIGAILFSRSIWQQIVGFESGEEGQLGMDESQLCQFCADTDQVIYVAMNTLAGHFAFSAQTEFMKEMYLANKSLFDIDESL